jgi:hypothetical protein
MVDSLGWSFGLPDKPEIADYVTILNGLRSRRFETEEIYIPSATAPLLPKEIRSFGPFSGQLWQRAPAREITAEFEFLLPISGHYEIRAAITGEGYTLTVNGQDFSADGERNFTEVTFGSTDLDAGQNKIAITIPPRGGIDYLLFDAPPAPRIEPKGGWQPEKDLSTLDLASTLSRALYLEPFLQPLTNKIVFEAENTPPPKNAKLSNNRYQGPANGWWLKTGMHGATFSQLFDIETTGIYDISMNILAKSEVEGLVNNRDHFRFAPKPYFTIIPVGTFYFETGANQIDIALPPRAGLDRIILAPRASSADDFLRLTGLSGTTEPTTGQLDQVLRLLAAIGVKR